MRYPDSTQISTSFNQNPHPVLDSRGMPIEMGDRVVADLRSVRDRCFYPTSGFVQMIQPAGTVQVISDHALPRLHHQGYCLPDSREHNFYHSAYANGAFRCEVELPYLEQWRCGRNGKPSLEVVSHDKSSWLAWMEEKGESLATILSEIGFTPPYPRKDSMDLYFRETDRCAIAVWTGETWRLPQTLDERSAFFHKGNRIATMPLRDLLSCEARDILAVEIWLAEDDELIFRNPPDQVDMARYVRAYRVETAASSDLRWQVGRIENLPEVAFHIFNAERPNDYHGHSLSVGDLVALLDANGVREVHAVDKIGFKAVAHNYSEAIAAQPEFARQYGVSPLPEQDEGPGF